MGKFKVIIFSISITALLICPAQPLSLVKINNTVGDTIDAFERIQYNLFPNINNFISAQIFFINDTVYIAEINYHPADSVAKQFFKLTSREVEKISYCIENADTIRNQIANDEFARLAFEKFWNDIELKTVTGFCDLSIRTKIQSYDNRAGGILIGTTVGTLFGGYLASNLAIKQIRPGGVEYLGNFGCLPIIIPYPPTYHVNQFAFWTLTTLSTATTTYIGYKIGPDEDRKSAKTVSPIHVESKWQGGCTALSIIPAFVLGYFSGAILASTRFGVTEPYWFEIDNDPRQLTAIPAIITGIGVTAVIIYVCNKIGQEIDHDNAVKKANKNKVK